MEDEMTERTEPATVAAVDWSEYVDTALAEISRAASLDELDAVRLARLGRGRELPQAMGQIRFMETHEPPIYMVSLGRCYRRDTPDPTHTPTFHQVEGLAVDRSITLADLKGTLLQLARVVFGPDREVRVRTSFFPFTEPSAEFDVSCFLCGGAGCNVCKHSGWIEMGGCGVVDPNVFVSVGYDPELWSGFAFGLGIDRIAMLRHGVPDLRLHWENDLRYLEQF